MKTEDRTEFTPERGAWAAAVALITAGWLYYLVFARVAVVELARPLAQGEDWRLRLLLTLLGAGGALGGLAAGWRFQVLDFPRSVGWACRWCGGAAVLALLGAGWTAMMVAAGCAGLGLGWLAVSVVSGLRSCVGTQGLGLALGAGTGLGFALAHVPVLFDASAQAQSILVTFGILGVSVLTPFLTPQEPSLATSAAYTRNGVIRWCLILLGLAVFAVAYPLDGHAPADTRSGSWPAVFIPGLVGVAAGWWLDRGERAALPLLALGGLVGVWLLWWLPVGSLAGSVGGAALVGIVGLLTLYYPARGGYGRLSGGVLALAGAGGSVVGTWLAQAPGRPPLGLLITVSVLAVLALFAHWRDDHRAPPAGAPR